MTGAASKARTLVEALPYIRAHRGTTLVVKVGGEALEEPSRARGMAEDLALLTLVGIKVVVVHGGGPQVTRAMEGAALAPRFLGGLRVTDEPTMEIVRGVLSGTINGDLVAVLVAAGVAAVGLSGADAGTLQARTIPADGGPDLGRVGRVETVDPTLILSLLADGFTPVVSPVTRAPDGWLNVNADAAASSLAAALGAAKLIYLTNVEGLYRDLGDSGSLISELEADELERMSMSLSSGMKPKADAALAALRGGVGKVHILDGRAPHAILLEVFTDEGIGTQVLA